jgi:hypothetical protein
VLTENYEKDLEELSLTSIPQDSDLSPEDRIRQLESELYSAKTLLYSLAKEKMELQVHLIESEERWKLKLGEKERELNISLGQQELEKSNGRPPPSLQYLRHSVHKIPDLPSTLPPLITFPQMIAKEGGTSTSSSKRRQKKWRGSKKRQKEKR